MRPDRLFGNLPPKRPLISLDAIVEDWQMRFINGDAKKYRDTVVDYCMKASSFEEAVQRACSCRNELGKKHNHQSKVQDHVLNTWSSVIILKTYPEHLQNFDELFDHLEEVRIRGIGPVTHYDVATRIGAYLKLEPEQLYLHAGVLDGWKLLQKYNIKWPIRVPRSSWPAELRCLPADQVEDLLCAYRTFLNPTMGEYHG
jgi:hypothetical protein